MTTKRELGKPKRDPAKGLPRYVDGKMISERGMMTPMKLCRYESSRKAVSVLTNKWYTIFLRKNKVSLQELSPYYEIKVSALSTILWALGIVCSSRSRAYGIVSWVQTRAYWNDRPASSATADNSPERPKPS